MKNRLTVALTVLCMLGMTAVNAQFFNKQYDVSSQGQHFNATTLKSTTTTLASEVYAVGRIEEGFGAGIHDGEVTATDPLGNLNWSIAYGNPGIDDEFTAVIGCDGSDDIIAVGRTNINGDYDMWAVRIDPGGNIIWSQQYGDASEEAAFAIESYDMGSDVYLIVGTTDNPNGAGTTSPYATLIDGSPGGGGASFWLNEYPALSPMMTPHNVTTDPGSGIFMMVGTTDYGPNGIDYFAFDIDVGGAPIFDFIVYDFGVPATMYGADINFSFATGEYIVTGSHFGVNFGSGDEITVFDIDAAKASVWGFHYEIVPEFNNRGIGGYQNPNTGEIDILVQSNDLETSYLKLDPTGGPMYTHEYYVNPNTTNTATAAFYDLNQDIYLFKTNYRQTGVNNYLGFTLIAADNQGFSGGYSCFDPRGINDMFNGPADISDVTVDNTHGFDQPYGIGDITHATNVAPCDCFLSVSETHTDENCGNMDGSITLSITSPAPIVSITWNGVPGTANHTNLSAGTYNWVVTDADGCQQSGSVVINNVGTAPTISMLIELTVNISGTGGTYVWKKNGVVQPGYTTQTISVPADGANWAAYISGTGNVCDSDSVCYNVPNLTAWSGVCIGWDPMIDEEQQTTGSGHIGTPAYVGGVNYSIPEYTNNDTGESNGQATGTGNETDAPVDYQLYPNPNNGNFTMKYPIMGETVEIMIYDMQGKLILSKEIKDADGETELKNTRLKEGIYFVRMYQDGIPAYSQRLVVSH